MGELSPLLADVFEKIWKHFHAILYTRLLSLFYKSWIILGCNFENDWYQTRINTRFYRIKGGGGSGRPPLPPPPPAPIISEWQI